MIGRFQVHDIELRHDFFEIIPGLPYRMSQGRISKIVADVPWYAIGTMQMHVALEGLVVIVNVSDEFGPDPSVIREIFKRRSLEYATSVCLVEDDSSVMKRLLNFVTTNAIYSCPAPLVLFHYEVGPGADMRLRLRCENIVLAPTGYHYMKQYFPRSDKSILVTGLTVEDESAEPNASVLPACNMQMTFSRYAAVSPSDVPFIEMNIAIDPVEVNLSAVLLTHIVQLLFFVLSSMRRFSYRHLRPTVSVQGHAAQWWQFAAMVIRPSLQNKIGHRQGSGEKTRFLSALRDRNRYLARFEQYALSNGRNFEAHAQMKEMEKDWNVSTILLYRYLVAKRLFIRNNVSIRLTAPHQHMVAPLMEAVFFCYKWLFTWGRLATPLGISAPLYLRLPPWESASVIVRGPRVAASLTLREAQIRLAANVEGGGVEGADNALVHAHANEYCSHTLVLKQAVIEGERNLTDMQSHARIQSLMTRTESSNSHVPVYQLALQAISLHMYAPVWRDLEWEPEVRPEGLPPLHSGQILRQLPNTLKATYQLGGEVEINSCQLTLQYREMPPIVESRTERIILQALRSASGDLRASLSLGNVEIRPQPNATWSLLAGHPANLQSDSKSHFLSADFILLGRDRSKSLMVEICPGTMTIQGPHVMEVTDFLGAMLSHPMYLFVSIGVHALMGRMRSFASVLVCRAELRHLALDIVEMSNDDGASIGTLLRCNFTSHVNKCGGDIKMQNELSGVELYSARHLPSGLAKKNCIVRAFDLHHMYRASAGKHQMFVETEKLYVQCGFSDIKVLAATIPNLQLVGECARKTVKLGRRLLPKNDQDQEKNKDEALEKERMVLAPDADKEVLEAMTGPPSFASSSAQSGLWHSEDAGSYRGEAEPPMLEDLEMEMEMEEQDTDTDSEVAQLHFATPTMREEDLRDGDEPDQEQEQVPMAVESDSSEGEDALPIVVGAPRSKGSSLRSGTFLSAFDKFQVDISAIHISLFNDAFGDVRPALRFRWSQLSADYRQELITSGQIAAEFFDPAASGWKAFLEPCFLECHLRDVGKTDLRFELKNGLRLNVHNQLISLMASTLYAYRAVVRDADAFFERQNLPPYAIRNRTGHALRVFKRGGDKMLVAVADGQEEGFRLESQTETLMSAVGAHNYIDIQVAGFEHPLRDVPIDGMLNLAYPLGQSQETSVICDVSMPSEQRIVTLCSPMMIENTCIFPLDIMIQGSGAWEGHPIILAPFAPDQQFHVPLALTVAGTIAVRKYGSKQPYLPDNHGLSLAKIVSRRFSFPVAAAATAATATPQKSSARGVIDIGMEYRAPQKGVRSLVFQSPIRLESRLPVQLNFSVVDSQSGNSVIGSLVPGCSKDIHSLDVRSNLMISMMIPGFTSSEHCPIRMEDTETLVPIRDNMDRPLFLRVRSLRGKDLSVRITIFCSFWIINRTGLNLFYSNDCKGLIAGQSSAGVKSTAMTTSWIETQQSAAKYLVLMGGKEEEPKLYLRRGDCSWSKSCTLSTALTYCSLDVPGLGDAIAEVVVGVEDVETDAYSSRVITLAPKLVLINHAKRGLEWIQGNAEGQTPMVLQPEEIFPVYWMGAVKEVRIRWQGAESWSAPFPLDVIGRTALAFADGSICHLVGASKSSTIYTCIYNGDEFPMPYRLCNSTDRKIYAYPQVGEAILMSPHSQYDFAWRDPYLEVENRTLTISCGNKVVKKIDPDQIARHHPSAHAQFPEGTFLGVTVEVREGTREIMIAEWSVEEAEAIRRMDNESQDEPIHLGFSVWCREVVATVYEKDNHFARATVSGLSMEVETSKALQSFEFSIGDMVVDSAVTKQRCLYKTENKQQEEKERESSAVENNKSNVFLALSALRDFSHSGLQYFQHLSLTLCPFSVILDERFLMLLYDYVKKYTLIVDADLGEESDVLLDENGLVVQFELPKISKKETAYVYFESLVIRPLDVQVGIKSAPKSLQVRHHPVRQKLFRYVGAVGQLNGIVIHFQELAIPHNYLDSSDEVIKSCRMFYVNQVRSQILKIAAGAILRAPPQYFQGAMKKGLERMEVRTRKLQNVVTKSKLSLKRPTGRPSFKQFVSSQKFLPARLRSKRNKNSQEEKGQEKEKVKGDAASASASSSVSDSDTPMKMKALPPVGTPPKAPIVHEEG
jgi:hypothetical protein